MQHQPVNALLKFCPHCNREYDQQSYSPPVKPFGDGVALARCVNPDCVNCGHPHYIPVHPELLPVNKQKVVLA